MTDVYSPPGVMTTPGRHASAFAGLPRDVGALVRVAQGLVVHEHITGPYGLTLTDERRATVHLRPVERLLDRILADDQRPLPVPRAPEGRLAGNRRRFTRADRRHAGAVGVPARARCGFGGYFGTGWFEDHWVCEVGEDGRWRLVDARIDDVQRAIFRPNLDLLDVPRDRFLVAGDAWVRCRAEDADPATFGLSSMKESGLWWIAANLVRDAAARSNLEMLPWDVWGAMSGPDEPIDDALLAFFDRLAELTRAPDAALAELIARHENDARVRVPATVRNAVLNRLEPV